MAAPVATTSTDPATTLPEGTGVPDVTVIVIVYNDEHNLETAVRSVTNQTLANLEVIIVNDASTDGSGDVARRLAAADPRVQAIDLPTNSGGCSAPRNAGLEIARGRYVMFLDSDDTLERHACKNLWHFAEEHDLVMVSGRCVRHHLADGRDRPWYDYLYTERMVIEDIADRPDQLYDTICTNKIYRRSFLDEQGLRFPEGLHYEDLLFTTEAYCAARRIGIIPNKVYVWNIAGPGASASITHRRLDLRNWQDRMEIHHRIDAFLATHEIGERLQVAKDRKVLNHDFKLFLRDLLEYPAAERQTLFDLVAPYIQQLQPEAFGGAHPESRIAAAFVLDGDVEGSLLGAEHYLTRQVPVPLVVEDGRTFWDVPQRFTDYGRTALDVTDRGWATAPFSALPLSNVVTEVAQVGATLQLRGRVNDQLGRMAAASQPLGARVEVLGRNGTVRLTASATTAFDGDRLTYDAALDLAAVARALAPADVEIRLRLVVTVGNEPNETAFVLRSDVPDLEVPVRTRYPLLLGDRIRLSKVDDVLGLVMTQSSPVLGKAAAVAGRARSTRAFKIGQRALKLRRGPAARRLFFRACQRLPIRPRTVVFESHLGRQYSDSPRYIYEELRRSGAPWTVYWSYDQSPAGFPDDAILLKRNSWQWLRALATSAVWVDNQGWPRDISKRPEQTYIQTWHGTPLKTMGFDEPTYKSGSGAARERLRQMVSRWDYFVVPSAYTADKLVHAFRYEGEVLRTGYPRNDLLVTDSDAVSQKEARLRLGLPTDRRIVLYAPTFRDRARKLRQGFELQLDLDVLEKLAETHYVLIRTHYLDRFTLPEKYARFVRDVSGEHDVTQLMLASDVLITDYSSVMFDWVDTGRPVVFYAYDLEDYSSDQRGTYFDLVEEAPGPVVATTDEVLAALEADPDALQQRYAERYAAFRERYSGYDDGHASERIVRQFFAPATPATSATSATEGAEQ